MVEKIMYLLVLLMICGSCTAGEVHKVGGSTGWTSLNINSSFYASWAKSKVFSVGDTIVFEYNKEFHDVVRVTHKNFNACNTTAPYAKWATGNDSFPITIAGHYYFICSVLGHCSAGQKVDIRVLSQAQQSPGPSKSGPSPVGPPAAGPDSDASGSNSDAPSPDPVASSPAQHPKKSVANSIHSHFKLWFYSVAFYLIYFICI